MIHGTRQIPKKIISLVPEDIKPYVVFNISLSVSDFVIKKYPFTICESWVRACAESGVWAMIQPASGYLCNFPYSISEEYEYFYKNYPNFIGWNWAEQNWGFLVVTNLKTIGFVCRTSKTCR